MRTDRHEGALMDTTTARTGRIRRHGRRLAISVAGAAVVLAGVAMLVLPGPGVLTLALGFGLLGKEYTWAARTYERIQARIATAGRALRPGMARERS
jgi:hypothetical protein